MCIFFNYLKMNGEVIRKNREFFGLTQEELAFELDVTRNTVLNWERDGVNSASKIKKIKSYFESYSAKHNVLDEPGDLYKLTGYKPKNDQLIPAYNVDFIAGDSFSDVENKAVPPDYYLDVPDFRGCTAFRAYSDSMEGLIKSGSLLFSTRVDSWREYLEYGQIYGVVCEDGRKFLKYIKRFNQDPTNYFNLVSENEFYDEFEMPKKSIRSVWLIHGHLTKRI